MNQEIIEIRRLFITSQAREYSIYYLELFQENETRIIKEFGESKKSLHSWDSAKHSIFYKAIYDRNLKKALAIHRELLENDSEMVDEMFEDPNKTPTFIQDGVEQSREESFRLMNKTIIEAQTTRKKILLDCMKEDRLNGFWLIK
jgi:hypothetical protein